MTEPEFSRLLQSLLGELHESPWLEFKCNNANPERVGEYVSAIANSAVLHDRTHGFVIWGIDDATRKPVGTTFSPSSAKLGGQPLLIHLSANLTPSVSLGVYEGVFEGHRIVVVRVPAAPGMPVAYKGERFIRVGESKTSLQGRDEERILFAKLDAVPFEMRAAKTRLAESEVLPLLDYPSYFELLKTPLPENRTAIMEQLLADRIIQKDPEGWTITNLGALLLARSLSKFDSLSRKAVRVVVYRSDDRSEIAKQQVGEKGYASGFLGLVQWINDQLPQNVHIGEALRAETKMYPENAIREIVANALIHQDLAMTGTGPLFEVFRTRIEITNPGTPLIDPRRFLDLPPRSRNERLAALMRRMGICEELGSGIDRVLLAVELFQLPAPDFRVVDQSLRVSLFSSRTFSEMDDEERIRAAYQHAGLLYLTGRRMTNASLRKRLGIKDENYPQVSLVIRACILAGLILPDDPENKAPRHAKYVPFWAAGTGP